MTLCVGVDPLFTYLLQASISSSQNSQQHKLEFLIGDHVLPYNMTVYQAIRHYSQEHSPSDTENDGEVPVSQSSIWLHTHTIYYRCGKGIFVFVTVQ